MKKCPICQKSFTRSMILKKSLFQPTSKLLGDHLTDGRGVIRCPHCATRLRKKISIWFIPTLVPFLISAIWYSINRQYAFLMVLSIILFVIFYVNLPYVPYDK